MEATANFPSPIPDFDATEFWAGCNRGELMMQRCASMQEVSLAAPSDVSVLPFAGARMDQDER